MLGSIPVSIVELTAREAELKTLVRIASGVVPLGRRSGSVGTIQDVLHKMRQRR